MSTPKTLPDGELLKRPFSCLSGHRACAQRTALNEAPRAALRARLGRRGLDGALETGESSCRSGFFGGGQPFPRQSM